MKRLKIICKTPKGKAKKAMKAFSSYFSLINKPKERKITSDSEFYFIYEYEKEKDMQKVINKKIPKTEMTIRKFYFTIIGLVQRVNKLGKRGAWTVEKCRRWILRRLNKAGYKEKDMEDFIDSIELDDLQEMLDFLAQDLILYEVL